MWISTRSCKINLKRPAHILQNTGKFKRMVKESASEWWKICRQKGLAQDPRHFTCQTQWMWGEGGGKQKQTFLFGSKIQDDEFCWVEMALWRAGPRIWGGLGGGQRQPKFIQTLCALISLNLLLDGLLIWLLPCRVTATRLHSNLQAPTQNLVNESQC